MYAGECRATCEGHYRFHYASCIGLVPTLEGVVHHDCILVDDTCEVQAVTDGHQQGVIIPVGTLQYAHDTYGAFHVGSTPQTP